MLKLELDPDASIRSIGGGRVFYGRRLLEHCLIPAS